MAKEKIRYNIFIESEKIDEEIVFNALCPILGLADYGKTQEEAKQNLKKLIFFHIESLLEEGYEIVTEQSFNQSQDYIEIIVS